MFIKLIKIRRVKYPKKILKSLAVFLLVTSWLLSGWPGVWMGPDLLFPPEVHRVIADTTSAVFPTLGETVSESPWSDNDWVSPTGIYMDDGTSASVTSPQYDLGDQTYVLKATGFDFSAIPDGSVINGVTARINSWYASGQGSGSVDLCQLLDTSKAKVGTNNCSTAVALTTDTATVITKGSTSDSWGNSLTTSWVKNPNFGIAIGIMATMANADVFVDYVTLEITYTPPVTTTLSTSSDPSPATVAPASGIRSAGQFTFTTSAGSDTITALTLTLAGSPAGSYAAIDSVSLRDTSCSGTLYFSAVTPSSDSVSFSGGTALSVSTSPGNTYYICVTPKDHTLASGTYSVSPYVSGTWTSGNGNTKAGTDDNANALTIDNTAPNGATSVSGTAGNAAITINWTTSDSSDFNTTSGSVVYRWASGSAGSEVPTEGSTPSVGSTNGTATAACVISSAGSSAQSKTDGTGGSSGCTTAALTNGQAYTYKVFQKDNYGNYDAGVSIGSFTPTAASATFTQNKYLWYVDNDLADPTDIWGNPDLIENQAIVVIPSGNDPPGTSQELRLRVNYVVNTTGISISEKYFKLEYKAGTDGTCTTGSWTDVGTGDWVYATSGVTDGADIVKVLSDTTTGKGQEYVKSKPSQANHVAASAAEIIEYDFHIVGTSATANTQYSFRVVETNNLGTTEVVFDGYASCPTLTTEPGTANLLRHGNVFTEGIEKGFFWVN